MNLSNYTTPDDQGGYPQDDGGGYPDDGGGEMGPGFGGAMPSGQGAYYLSQLPMVDPGMYEDFASGYENAPADYAPSEDDGYQEEDGGDDEYPDPDEYGDSYVGGLSLLGTSTIGEYNIQAQQRQMNTLKQVTVSVAKVLVRGAQKVANETITLAHGGIFDKELPGITSLKNTQGHLQWHADKLAGLSDPMALYDSSDDVKKWAMQAWIDANAVEEGRARQGEIWDDMWTEIGQELAKMPAKIVKAVVALPGQAFEGLTGIPSWVFWVGGGVLVLGVGVGVWKLITLATPAVAHVAAQRYLP